MCRCLQVPMAKEGPQRHRGLEHNPLSSGGLSALSLRRTARLVTALMLVCCSLALFNLSQEWRNHWSTMLRLVIRLFSTLTVVAQSASAAKVTDLGQLPWTLSSPTLNITVPGKVPSSVRLTSAITNSSADSQLF